jgi:uncharacterized membrane protein (DUF2068 family)
MAHDCGFPLDYRMARNRGERDKWVIFIGIAKLIKGLLLLAVGIGALKLLHKDAAAEVTRWLHRLYADPNGHFFHKVLGKLSGLDTRKLLWGTLATFVYASLFLTEGIGLLLRKRWAEYFTVVVTGSFIPLEIYELAKEFNGFKLAVTIANAAIVAYLVRRLKTKKR